MQVQFSKNSNVSATIQVSVAKEDYQEKVNKELQKYQKQVAVKGFRVGHAPMALIKNIYEKEVKSNEVLRSATDGLYNYLKENDVDIVAQPIDKTEASIWDDLSNKETFDFTFDLGIIPDFEINFDNTKLDRYVIMVNDADVDKEIEYLQTRHKNTIEQEKVENNSTISVKLEEINVENEVVADGKYSFAAIELEKTNNAETAKLIGQTKDFSSEINVFELYNNDETAIKNVFRLPAEEDISAFPKNFKLTINKINIFETPEVNQEFFDKVLGENVVKNLEEFRAKLKENLEVYYKNEAEHHIDHMIGHVIDENIDLELPSDFLKQWLLLKHPEVYNAENVDEKMGQEIGVLRKQIIRERVAKKYGLKLEPQDIENASIGYSLNLFRQYGLANPEFEMVKKFSDDQMKNEKHREFVMDIALQQIVNAKIKELVSYTDIPVGIDQFYEALKQHNASH